LYQPQQLAKKHQALFARCDTCHIAPSGLFLPALAVVPVAAVVAAAAAAAAVQQAEVLVAVSAVESPLPPTISRFNSQSPRQRT